MTLFHVVWFHLIYKVEDLFVRFCLCVYLYLIQINISEPIWITLFLHLSSLLAFFVDVTSVRTTRPKQKMTVVTVNPKCSMNINSFYILKYYISDTHNYRKIFSIYLHLQCASFNALEVFLFTSWTTVLWYSCYVDTGLTSWSGENEIRNCTRITKYDATAPTICKIT